MKGKISPTHNSSKVDEFMAKLDHPFKAEVQAVREIILGVDKRITEEIKWAAPTFSYNGYIVTFNLWAKQQVHLVFHNGAILSNTRGLLEGNYPDRRMAYFSNMKDVRAKRPALEALAKEWVRRMDKQLKPSSPKPARRPAMKRTPAKNVDEYLAAVPEEALAALEKLRKTIKAAAPKATEAISYGMPTFKYEGRALVYFAAFTNHCSFFPASLAVIGEYRDELKPYDVSKGTIHFLASKPLPAGLVRKIVKARIAEIETKVASY